MRVIGGDFRSRLLKSLPGLDVRPTPDRLREALFNLLAPRTEGTVFANIYAGTGAVGIGALSRGAARATFVEQHRDAVAVIRANLKTLGLEPRAHILQANTAGPGIRINGPLAAAPPRYKLKFCKHDFERTRVRQSDIAARFYGAKEAFADSANLLATGTKPRLIDNQIARTVPHLHLRAMVFSKPA